MMKRLAPVILLLLCQCATKHQPVEFPPYFPIRPQSYFSAENLIEISDLENRPALGLLEKKRLSDLYALEIKQLKPGSPRYSFLTTASASLAPELESTDRELRSLQSEISKHREPPTAEEKTAMVWETAAFKRDYFVAYNLWNKDQNDLALRRANELGKNQPMKDKATKAEWYKLLNLRFRISLDLMDLNQAFSVYQEMKDADSCHLDTAAAGFLIALQMFSNADPKGASAAFEKQCDPDKTPGNIMKRLYWSARFQEQFSPAEANRKYEEIVRAKVPGFYFYMAHTRLGRKIEFPPGIFRTRSYLKNELDVSGTVHELLTAAEDRLQQNLRRDASLFLVRASQILREASPPNIPALLYTAHLFQAAGNQLESMKAYAVVSSALQEENVSEDHPSRTTQLDFLEEMFPRPHSATVDWVARQWETDPDFIYSIMRQESAFNPGAVSLADARGLMQMMPSLARTIAAQWSYQTYYADRLLFHARENIKLAVFHLHQLRAVAPHFALIAASYNAGLSRVTGWWRRNRGLPLDVFIELIPVNETRNYVKLVLRNYIHYKALRNNGTVDVNAVPLFLPPFTPPYTGVDPVVPTENAPKLRTAFLSAKLAKTARGHFARRR